MRNLRVVCLIVVFLIAISTNALALSSPSVSPKHGVITGAFVSEEGLIMGVEYGFNSNLAFLANLGDPLTRLGLKYEVNPTFALTFGVTDFSPFMGINGSVPINREFTGLYETFLTMGKGDIALFYEFGLKFNLAKNIDVHGGFIGYLAEKHFPHLELGFGYKF